jgi:hypothetical protein
VDTPQKKGLAREREPVRERVLHRANVRKSPAGIDDGHVRPGVAPEEVEPRVGLGGVSALLRLGVDVIEDLPAHRGVGAQAVDNVHGGLRVKAHVPGVAERAQRVARPVAFVCREKKPLLSAWTK